MQYIIYSFVILIVIIFWLLRKNYMFIGGLEIKSFSGNSNAQKVKNDLQLIQIRRYSRQQAWSYALLWISIFASMILGGLLIYKNFVIGQGDHEWLAELIGLAGGGGVSLTSFNLYRSSSKKIDELLENVKV